MGEWWETFFDQDYLRIAGQMFTEEDNNRQAAELWSMLDLNPASVGTLLSWAQQAFRKEYIRKYGEQ